MNTIILHISYDLTIGHVNLNEIIYELKEIQNQVFIEILKVVLLEYQEEIVKRLTSKCFPEERKGLGFHSRKNGKKGSTCGGRTVKKRGFRSQFRTMKTVFGNLKLPVREVECLKCGYRYSPLLSALGIEKYSQKEGNFEHEVIEAVIDTNYRRLIEGRSIDISLGGVHNIVVGSDIDKAFQEDIETHSLTGMLGDGTGLKQYQGKKGELRTVVGINTEERVVPIGSWTNTTWDKIEEEIKKRFKTQKKLNIPFVYDGEPGLKFFLEGVVNGEQRCTWHGPRGLYHSLWQDGFKKAETQIYQNQLKGMIGIEIPVKDYEVVTEEDKESIKMQYERSKKELGELIELFEKKRYSHATSYLKSLSKSLWRYVEIWLETGIISPKTTSLLERTFRELGRRLKKIAWGWSDRGATHISKMILLKQYARDKWEAFWKKKLGIKGAFSVSLTSIKIA